LCLEEDECKAVCAAMDNCFGIDMHETLPRCFLNTVEKGEGDADSCKEYIIQGTLSAEDNYNFHYKQAAPAGRRLATNAPKRKLLSSIDVGMSWNQILRFTGVSFETGGKFKACFCDHQTLAHPDSVCASASDYKIEIGTVHVSGVSCLITEPKFQRGTCVSQHWGGLRCYGDAGDVPSLQVPDAPVDDDASDSDGAAGGGGGGNDGVISTWCLYGPEEETRDDPDCMA